MSVHPSQVVINLSMMQHFFGVPSVDGVYWTLAYEITFYVAVTALLLLGWQTKLNTVFMLWPPVLAVSLLLGFKSLPYLGGYYCFFSAGALFGVLKQEFRWRAALSLILSYVLCLQFSIGHAAKLAQEKGVIFSSVIVVLLITVFFALFLYQNTDRGQSLRLPFSRTLGALTYPVYLIHAHFGYMIINRFATNQNRLLVYALTIFVVITTALCIHKFIEQHLSGYWKRSFTASVGRFINFLEHTMVRVRGGR